MSKIIDLPPRFFKKDFSNLREFTGNKKAIKAAKTFRLTSSLYLFGETGTGKTHLAISIAKTINDIVLPSKIASELKTKTREAKILFLDFNQYIENCLKNRFSDKWFHYLENLTIEPKNKYNLGFQNEIIGYDCIILDDISTRKFGNEYLFTLINGRYNNSLSMIITSNLPLEELEVYEKRSASRISEMAKIFEIRGEDYRLKRNI